MSTRITRARHEEEVIFHVVSCYARGLFYSSLTTSITPHANQVLFPIHSHYLKRAVKDRLCDFIHETNLISFAAADTFCCREHLKRASRADESGQALCAAPARDDS